MLEETDTGAEQSGFSSCFCQSVAEPSLRLIRAIPQFSVYRQAMAFAACVSPGFHKNRQAGHHTWSLLSGTSLPEMFLQQQEDRVGNRWGAPICPLSSVVRVHQGRHSRASFPQRRLHNILIPYKDHRQMGNYLNDGNKVPLRPPHGSCQVPFGWSVLFGVHPCSLFGGKES